MFIRCEKEDKTMVGKKLTLILTPELAQMLETLKNTEAFRERSQAEMLRTLIRAGLRAELKKLDREALAM